MHAATFHQDWSVYFDKLEDTVKERVVKKIRKIIEYPQKRHLGGRANYFVDEVGQYRILYMVFDEKKEVRFYFVGNHKDYERWYKQFF
jgi:mRNA-degrading endonuclease RelE of RelBE toxin-antitoxin system